MPQPQTRPHALEVMEGRETEAPRPSDQGATAASRPPSTMVAALRRHVNGEPTPGRTIFGKKVTGWHRTDTAASGQSWVLGLCYTKVGIKFEDGSVEYATAISARAL